MVAAVHHYNTSWINPQPAIGVAWNPKMGNGLLGKIFGNERTVVAGGRWYFHAAANGVAIELYTSDGTPAGTSLLKAINSQTSALDPSFLGTLFGPHPLADLGGTLLFRATDGITGQEPWKSDGTPAGTAQTADLVPGSGASFPNQLTTVGGAVFFLAQNDANEQLWKTDGTSATLLANSLEPVDGLTALGSTLLFSADSGQGVELWKSDGTPGGTGVLKDINPGLDSSYPAGFTALGSIALFSATSATGEELWRSDGTAAGTVPVLDIQPGAGSSSPSGLLAAMYLLNAIPE